MLLEKSFHVTLFTLFPTDKEALSDFKPEGLDSAGVEDMVREWFNKCDPVSQTSSVFDLKRN